jgi:hypothetical protein
LEDREGLGPKRNIVSLKKKTAAIQVEHITIKPQLPRL